MSQLALSGSTSSLPAEVSEFVGRRQDRAALRRLLEESRLVTLTGMGGVGKSRLALRMALELRRAFRDGVWFVPLGELSDHTLLAETTAAVLGIHDRSRRVGVVQLAEYLQSRELLLVLDNCEHLIEDCAVVVDSLLRACPRLRILATSREALRVQGEAVRPVAPLSVPDSEAGPADVHESEAVRLFVQRASHVTPGFALDEANRTAVLGICQHLEGMPLALELAAVRMRAMSAPELHQRLLDDWELLDLGSRGAPYRHRTMTACIEWSHALCTPAERRLWEQLAVFAGGAEMDAVGYTAAERDLSGTDEHLAHLLQSLVDKSILTVDLHDGRARYRMQELLRRFGKDRLESAGQLAAARRRHRDFYVELLARIDEEWMSPAQTDWMRRLRREEANLRIALDFSCTEPGEGDKGLELASRLRKYDIAYGGFTEARKWLDRLLAHSRSPSMTRVRGLRAASWLAVMQGDHTRASIFLDEARQIAPGIGAAAMSLVFQAEGQYRMSLGDLQSAIDSLNRAIEGMRSEGSLRDVAESYMLLGMTCGLAGDLDRAAAAHQTCLDICERSGESWFRSYSLWQLGLVIWAGGDPTHAVELEKQSLRLKRRIDERFGVALSFEALAWIQTDADPQRAAVLLGAADALWRLIGTSLETLPDLNTLRRRSEGAARDTLGAEQFRVAHGQGGTMELPSAIAYALGENSAVFRTERSGPKEQRGRLTKREREIAALVAIGLTNREIATRLVISVRTAEAHVENILTKLGFTSRTQIAAWFAERED
ncbi:ATP-binding protein [Pimelobacter simplex]|uniref:ATP-binding protein n=1 Tax=Nocardioides simplex TaxID=2045 RepID=UPI001ECBFD34|nr:LuxR family transcriptional regulator [Pimelobacter simplex]